MEPSKIPFNFYDNIAIIFPGTMLIGLIMRYFPQISIYKKEINQISGALLVLVFIILSFICGHISYILSKNLSEDEKDKIIELIEIVYKTDFNLKININKYRKNEIKGHKLRIKNYCFALV